MVYFEDMCKSKLGKLMCAFRADRPDEWRMDEFIQSAEEMEERISELERQRDELLSVLESIGAHAITDEDGDEIEVLFGNVDKIIAAIAKAKGGAA